LVNSDDLQKLKADFMELSKRRRKLRACLSNRYRSELIFGKEGT